MKKAARQNDFLSASFSLLAFSLTLRLAACLKKSFVHLYHAMHDIKLY